jgi:hypothetical protein
MARNFRELVHRLHGVFLHDLSCPTPLESEGFHLRFRSRVKILAIPQSNKSLGASGGGVFRNLIGPAMLE